MGDRLERREVAGLDRTLDSLASLPQVVGLVVATDDGLPLAVRLPPRLDGEALAAAAAAAGCFARNALDDVKLGDLDMVLLEASRLILFVCPLSVGYLVTIAEPGADLNALAPEVNAAARAAEQASAWLVASPGAPAGG